MGFMALAVPPQMMILTIFVLHFILHLYNNATNSIDFFLSTKAIKQIRQKENERIKLCPPSNKISGDS